MKSKVEYEESWLCDTCNDKSSMTRGQVLYHLQEVHKIKPPFQGKREMMMHIDGAKEFSSFYNWTIDSVKLTQAMTEPR